MNSFDDLRMCMTEDDRRAAKIVVDVLFSVAVPKMTAVSAHHDRERKSANRRQVMKDTASKITRRGFAQSLSFIASARHLAFLASRSRSWTIFRA